MIRFSGMMVLFGWMELVYERKSRFVLINVNKDIYMPAERIEIVCSGVGCAAFGIKNCLHGWVILRSIRIASPAAS